MITKNLDEDRNNTLRVNVFSISGLYFPNQVALLCNVNDAMQISNIQFPRADISLASSGGNICAYADMASKGKTNRLLSIVKNIDYNMFVKPWFPPELGIPSFLAFKGSIYQKGYGSKFMFNSLFNNEDIKDREIWTGTYDTHNCRSQFFCNKGKHESYINSDIFDINKDLYDSMSLIYADGNIDLISKYSTASASVPILVEGEKINGILYRDGGVTYASPLSALSNEICRIVNNKYTSLEENKNMKKIISFKNGQLVDEIITKQKNLRLIYFSSYQINERNKTCGNSEIAQFKEISRQILHMSVINDKNKCFDILKFVSNNDIDNIKTINEIDINVNRLSELLSFLETKKHYTIILMPKGSDHLSNYIFTEDEIERVINKTRSVFSAYIYYYNIDK